MPLKSNPQLYGPSPEQPFSDSRHDVWRSLCGSCLPLETSFYAYLRTFQGISNHLLGERAGSASRLRRGTTQNEKETLWFKLKQCYKLGLHKAK